ncbi:MAG: hypothetical protein HYX92_03050 [Chloroflexi bacterium]|nr:hypothetical protein [Chloroflexota bacterium]
MPSPRIVEMKKEHVPKYYVGDDFSKPVRFSVLRSRYYTETWKETEGEPISVRRAKALARYLDNMPLYIRPFELIVGFHAEDPHCLPLCIEGWDQRSVTQYINAGRCKSEDLDEWHELIEYWKPRSLGTLVRNQITHRDFLIGAARNRYMEALPGETGSRTQPDHDTYLETGLNQIVETLYGKLADLNSQWEATTGGTQAVEIRKKIYDLRAMIISAEAVLRWAKRYSRLAKEMADNEADPERKKELEQISEICAWVPGNPPRTFWEALQSHWLAYLAYHIIEVMCHGTSMRTDQVFWPWYEKDVLIDKSLPRQKALDLMEEYLLHVDELGRPAPAHRRRTAQGNNFLATYTLGGVKAKDGSDACNELTILILDALDDLRVSHPDHKFRWHPRVNPRVWKRVVEVVRSGLGQPSIKNDEVVIGALMDHYGFTLEEARSWAVVGCVAPAPTIHWGRARRDAYGANALKPLELTLNNGVDPLLGHEPEEFRNDKILQALAEDPRIGPPTGDPAEFRSFEELLEAYRQQMRWMVRKASAIKTIYEHMNNEHIKRPFASCLFHRSLDACRDIMDVYDKGMPWMNCAGTVDAADTLISLKKLVFDDKKYTMAEVLKAIRANWEGYEEMRRDFINAPKFGNDDAYADEIARWVYSMIADEMAQARDVSNQSPMRSGLVVSRMFQLAPHVGAMPNGRKAGDWLGDGGVSPHAKYDRSGPMAAILSAAKIDHRKHKANLFNQKLTPASVAGEAGLRKLQNYIETAMHLGLDMIQFNVIDVGTLKEAQARPEKHAELVVRVSGFNAHFVDLNRFVQDSIIERTEHALA